MTKSMAALVALAIALTAACTTGAAQGEVVRGSGYEGAIFSGPPFYYGEVDGSWRPTAEQVAELEEGLKPYLEKAVPALEMQIAGGPKTITGGLAKYRRQYTGIVRKGRRIIYVNFFCDSFGTDWMKEQVIVMDGGSCYFQLEYDIEKKSYGALRVNGEA